MVAGADDALRGKWVLGNPQVGDYFLNEYAANQSEDETGVVGINETAVSSLGTFTNCVKYREGSRLFPEKEYKYLCKDSLINGMAVEEDLLPPENIKIVQTSKLIRIEMTGAISIPIPHAYLLEGVKSVND